MKTENDILFEEHQQFKQWWLWMILAGVNVLFLYGIYIQVIGGHSFGDKPMSDAGLIIATTFTFLLTFFFVCLRLDTIIKRDGIYVRFFPFQIKYKYFSWQNLSRLYVREYNPLAEFGGWGLRIGSGGNNKAYNISGNKGLQLESTNQKKLLIGTKKPEEVEGILREIGQWKD